MVIYQSHNDKKDKKTDQNIFELRTKICDSCEKGE